MRIVAPHASLRNPLVKLEDEGPAKEIHTLAIELGAEKPAKRITDAIPDGDARSGIMGHRRGRAVVGRRPVSRLLSRVPGRARNEHPRQGWCTVSVPDHDAAESDLLTTTLAIYRESLPNDRSMFNALIVDWSALSPAHRALVYKIGDALRNAAAWRKRVK